MAKMQVTVEFVPLQGKTEKKTVELDPSGASVGEVLAKAGIDPNGKTIRLNGQDVGVDHHLAPSSAIEVKGTGSNAPPPAPRVSATERPQGS